MIAYNVFSFLREALEHIPLETTKHEWLHNAFGLVDLRLLE